MPAANAQEAPQGLVPGLPIPGIELPDLNLPNVGLPDLPVPGVGLPELSAAGATQDLKGLFGIKPGQCSGASPSGSYFRMVAKLGNPTGGPFVPNLNSPCADKTVTPFTAGSDGGFSTSRYQPEPNPAFDAVGNGTSAKLTEPAAFFVIRFATATNAVDPQTSTSVPLPKVTYDGAGKLSGDIRAFAASWSGQHFNQGAPKPDGSLPGYTTAPTGTYDPSTRAYTLQWSSSIVGGPFDGFTGLWHFAGTFTPDVVAAPVPAAQPVSNTIPTEVQANVLADTGTDVAGTLLLGLLLIGLGVATEVYGRRIGSAGGRG